MVLEYLENIVQLLLILVALLASLFRYISSKKRGWLYAVIFFTSSLLSSYFWTSYLVIMGDSPNASVFLTYFGWNVSYFGQYRTKDSASDAPQIFRQIVQ